MSKKASVHKKVDGAKPPKHKAVALVLMQSVTAMNLQGTGDHDQPDHGKTKPTTLNFMRPDIIESIKEQFSDAHERRILHNPRSVTEFISQLQKPDVNVNEYNYQGDTPLHSLVKRKFKKKHSSVKYDLLLAMLVHSDIDINRQNGSRDGNTSLHLAVEGGDMKTVKILLSFGAHINALNSQNKTPLDLVLGPYRLFERQESIVREPEISVAVDEPDVIHRSSTYPRDCSTVSNSLPPRVQYERLSSTTTSSFVNSQDLGEFLKKHGAVRGRSITKSHSPMSPRNPVGMFGDVSLKEKAKKLATPLPMEKTSHHMLGDDWTINIPKLYYQLANAIEKKLSDVTYSISQNPDDALVLATQLKELRMLREAGSRILFLDGGGIRGLIQIEILSQLEEQTGRRITELFDWIVGTSTGGIIALGLVHGKKTLKELRQIYHRLKEEVVDKPRLGVAFNTTGFEEILRTEFGDMRLDEVTHPRVLVSAVDKSTVNLKLQFFNNCFDDGLCSEELWKVARYTSAAPMFFNEMDNYVDGGVLANNPASSGLTRIQDFYRDRGQRLPISLVVSVGTGKLPEDELGRADIQDYLYFGKHWFNFKDSLTDRIGNLTTLLNQAITGSEEVAANVRSRCLEQGISYYRFNPQLSEVIPMGETDEDKLTDMVLLSKSNVVNQTSFSKLVLRFHQCSLAHRKMAKRSKSRQPPSPWRY